jgi:colanic acid/amylovoran biosynthesis protein WcaK/AmsJ
MKAIKRRLVRFYVSWVFPFLRFYPFLWLQTRFDRVDTNDAAVRVIIIPPPGNGNIGDQALLESVVRGISAPTVVFIESEMAYDRRFVSDVDFECEFVVCPGLVYGGPKSFSSYRLFRQYVSVSSGLYLIGADIMDGKYNLHASIRRSELASLVARSGGSSRVVGFSFNVGVSPIVIKSLQYAEKQGVKLLFRDSLSYERGRACGLEGGLTSDVVFSDSTINEFEVGGDLLKFCLKDKPFVVVNVSGLLFEKARDISIYKDLIILLKSRGARVCLLPHVFSPYSNDLDACNYVSTLLDNEDILIANKLHPGQVRWLVGRAFATISSRMHLAVFSLSMGTPVVCVESQGKVRGLFQYFDFQELCVNKCSVKEGATNVFDNYSYYKNKIDLNLGRVKSLAGRNFL